MMSLYSYLISGTVVTNFLKVFMHNTPLEAILTSYIFSFLHLLITTWHALVRWQQ